MSFVFWGYYAGGVEIEGVNEVALEGFVEGFTGDVFENVAENTETRVGVDGRFKRRKVRAQFVKSIKELWICMSVQLDSASLRRTEHIPLREQRVSEVAPVTGKAQGAMPSG